MAVPDGFPVSPGHALLIPRRHLGSFFDLNKDERADLLDLLDAVTQVITSEYGPQGYNVGFNDGSAAGQTVMHFHLHVIPRYPGDVPDPRGGIRWIFPTKARYWEEEP